MKRKKPDSVCMTDNQEKKAFGQLSKYDLESLTRKCEISQGEELLFKIKSYFEFWEKQKVDNRSSNSNIF